MTENQRSAKAGDHPAQPPVTIGMPVYNGIEFIDQALGALLDQSYPNFALVVSDNGSTDGTWERLLEWAARDARIVLHRQDSNIGAMRNFRYVLDQAQTEYFMWHAYDDWLASNYVEELVRVITTEPGCTLACATIQRTGMDGTPIRQNPAPLMTGVNSAFGRALGLLRCPQSPWIYGLFRTEDLRCAQTVAEEFGYLWAADHLMLLQFILNDRIRGTDRTVFYRRKTGISSQTYRPSTPSAQLRFVWRYLKFQHRLLHASSLSPAEKLLCWPRLLGHARRTLGLYSFKRHVRRPVKRFLKSIVPISTRTSSGRR